MLIKEITLVLENCEEITIDGKYIGDFHLGDIKFEISRIACNAINMMEVCHDFFIELHADANKVYYPFGVKDENETRVFDRLTRWNDITQIDIVLYDKYAENPESTEIKKHYLFHWSDDEMNNAYQSSKIAKTGWLYLCINQNRQVSDYLTADNDDPGYADMTACMCDIGDKYCEENV